MNTRLVLKNGFRFSGEIIGETQTHLILEEIKLGKTSIDKTSIAARSDCEGGSV